LEVFLRWKLLISVLCLATSAWAADPINICIAQPSGPETKNWKLQKPLAQRMETVASARKLTIIVPLLESNDEKHAKTEARDKSCSYILISTLESSGQTVFGTFNPSPTGRSVGDIDRSVSATPHALTLKYKLITPDGKKIQAASVPMQLKESEGHVDYEEAGRTLIDKVATQVIAALPQ
jgi:hypothetical protein